MADYDDELMPAPAEDYARKEAPSGGNVFCDDVWPGYPTRQDAMDNEDHGIHCTDPDGEFLTPPDPGLQPNAGIDEDSPGMWPQTAEESAAQQEGYEQYERQQEAIDEFVRVPHEGPDEMGEMYEPEVVVE